MKIAVVFDNRIRQDTTGKYFQWGMERLGHEVSHILPDEALTMKKPAHDLYVKVDDGLKQFTEWNERLKPCCYWAIDVHYYDAAEWRPKIAEQMDWTFCAQKNALRLPEYDHLLSLMSWLPLAADEDLHSPNLNGHDKYDWAFVGNVGHAQPDTPNKRMDYLDALLKEFPNAAISDYSFYKEMANLYGQSKVVFNTCINNDINMRFWEGLCSGAYLVTEKVYDNGIKELENWPGAPLSGCFSEYVDYKDLSIKMEVSLEMPKETLGAGKQGRDMILSGHTYQHRCKSILEHFEL